MSPEQIQTPAKLLKVLGICWVQHVAAFKEVEALVDSALNPQNESLEIGCELVSATRLKLHLINKFKTVIVVLPQKKNVCEPVHFVLCVYNNRHEARFLHRD